MTQSTERLRQEKLLRALVREDLTLWAEAVLQPQGMTPAAHHRLLLRHLAAVAAGVTDRLMVLMPPGSAKSTYVSEIFPAWWFTQHPASAVIAASHTAELAHHFGRRVRNLVLENGERLGYGLADDDRAAARWRTTGRGQYFAAGVRGPITGRRADLVIIDDPVKSQAEADSALLRDHAWDWFRADLVTRLKPGGRIVVVMTRWHEDDLGGRLLRNRANEWTVVKLPALAEADDPLKRAVGEALWPQWEDAAALERKRETVGERVWASLYQQQPRPADGAVFDAGKLRIVDSVTGPYKSVVRGWDFAGTEKVSGNNPDWTAGVKLALGFDDVFYVLHVCRMRQGWAKNLETIQYWTHNDGRGVTVSIPEDPGSAGKFTASRLIAELRGHDVRSSRETGSKVVRAQPVAAQANAGHLAVVRADWTDSFIDELAGFPHAQKDDQVDALSRAFAQIVMEAPKASTRRTDFFQR